MRIHRVIELPTLAQRRNDSDKQTLWECEMSLWGALKKEFGADFQAVKSRYTVSHDNPRISCIYPEFRFLVVVHQEPQT